ARHGDDLPVSFQGFDETQFLLRHDASEEVDAADALLQILGRHRIHFRTGNAFIRIAQPDLPRDAVSGCGIVAGDHDHADARLIALANRVGNRRPYGIFETD